MATSVTTLERAALSYTVKNWKVFPLHGIEDGQCTCQKPDCTSAGKHPRTPHGLLDATTDQKQIKAWWGQWPNANIGVRTGQVSGIFAIDLDIKTHDGPGHWRDLLDFHGPADTLTAFTGGGGQHWVFAQPEGVEIRNDAGTALGLGIDVRGDGGYIVVWPSLHLSGDIYEWDNLVYPTAAPQWLIDQCSKQRSVPSTPPSDDNEPWVTQALDGVDETHRNGTAARLVGYFHHKGIAPDIIQKMLGEFAERCNPPMDLKELQRTITSVTRYERQVVENHIIDPPEFEEQAGGLRYHWPHHGITIYVEEIFRMRDGGLHSEITLEAILPGVEPMVHGPVGFNLTSTTTRASLVKYLTPMASVNWGALLDTICRLSVAYHRLGEPIIDLAQYQGSPPHWLLWPFLLDNEISIVFGDGGSGKTFLGLATALSIQQNTNIMGFEPHGSGRGLYLDWETSPGTHADRLRKIVGSDKTPSLSYIRCTAPFHEMTRWLKKHITEGGYKVIYVDSIAAACGGKPEDAEVALRMCNAIRSLDVSCMLIGHQTKTGDRSEKPFGSTFWHNEARSTLEVRKASEESTGSMKLGLYQRKYNDGELAQPQGLVVNFTEDGITFERNELARSPSLRRGLPAREQILGYFHGEDDSGTAEELAKALNLEEKTIQRALNRGDGDHFIKLSTNGAGDVWGPKLKTTETLSP